MDLIIATLLNYDYSYYRNLKNLIYSVTKFLNVFLYGLVITGYCKDTKAFHKADYIKY